MCNITLLCSTTCINPIQLAIAIQNSLHRYIVDIVNVNLGSVGSGCDGAEGE